MAITISWITLFSEKATAIDNMMEIIYGIYSIVIEGIFVYDWCPAR